MYRADNPQVVLVPGVKRGDTFKSQEAYEKFGREFGAKIAPIQRMQDRQRAESELASMSHRVD